MLKKIFIKLPGFFNNKKSIFFKRIISSLKKDNFGDTEFYKKDFGNFYFRNYKPEIKMINNIRKIPFKKNFILSGLNLAFLGSFGLNRVPLSKYIYHWPDGIFHSRLFGNQSKKIPGREIIEKIKIPDNITLVRIIGNLSKISKKALIKRFPYKKILHTKLGYGNLNDEIVKVKNIRNNELIFLTLPSPKQEIFALKLFRKFKKGKIICIGGAINIFSGEEKAVPEVLDKLGLEFIWRLKTETRRRSLRLFTTFLGYLSFENSNVVKRIKLSLL